ncbi:MAG: FAD-binding protein [Gammaproteobacteria bacterium]
MRNNPHDKINHADFDWLGYDWGKVGDRSKTAVHPFDIYLPASVDAVKQAVKNAQESSAFMVRANGHSDNALVVGKSPDVPVICMRNLTAITETSGSIIQNNGNTDFVRAQSGLEIGDLEDRLAKEGYGLPIAPDHRHITLGGFASAGGISAASHLYGLFVDNIIRLEILENSTGQISVCTGQTIYDFVGKASQPDFIILSLDLVVINTNKRTSLLEQKATLFRDPTDINAAIKNYIDAFVGLKNSDSNTKYVRGTWFRMGKNPQAGVVAKFTTTKSSGEKWVERNERIAQLDAIGAHGGNLPENIAELEEDLKLLAWQKLADPRSALRYQTYEDTELFTDKVVDSSVGTPTYMLAIFVPIEHFPSAFKSVLDICNNHFGNPLKMFALYSRVINSNFLSGKGRDKTTYADISIFAGVTENAGSLITSVVKDLDSLASSFNAQLPQDGYPVTRYMVTQTTFRPGTNDPRDPASHW